MLILAGVSLNAIVGDNGIISNAQQVTIKNSMAVLEEFLQEKYVENFEMFDSDDSKVLQLQSIYPSYFYMPSTEGIGTLKYIVDSEGHALYLIKKNGLPESIKSELIGGDAGSGMYKDYSKLTDVYGVTSDLKVYYANGSELIGISSDNLDKDNPLRTVVNSSSNSTLYDLIENFDKNGDNNVSAEEAKSITNLEISSDSQLQNFSEFYNFPALRTLYLSNKTMDNFNGIENCTSLYYISCDTCTFNNYSSIGKLENKLKYLYFYNIDQEELEKICSKTVGIGNYDLPNLNKLAFSGTKSYIGHCSIYNTSYYSGEYGKYSIGNKNGTKSINSLVSLANLTTNTKKAVKYLSIGCNAIESLVGLEGFSQLYLIRAERNCLTNLTGIENLNNLQLLYVPFNNLTSLASFVSGSKLYEICLTHNTDLTTLSGLDNCTNLAFLYARDCKLGYSIEEDSTQETDALYSLKNKKTLAWIDLTNNSSLSYVEYLKESTAIGYIRLTGCTNINKLSISKIKNVIIHAGSRAYIPSMYNLALLDSNTKYLDLKNEEISKDDLQVIGNYTELIGLSLRNTKIYISTKLANGEVSKTYLDNFTTPTIDEAFNSTLSLLTKMKFLDLYGVSNLSDISFIEQMEELKELDIRQTNILNLSVLEEQTNSGNLKLGCLAVDKAGTNLGLIPKTIDNLYTYATDYWNFVDNTRHGGLLCRSSEVFSTLNGSDISKLKVHHYSDTGTNVDLTSCNNLNYVCLGGEQLISLPNCVTNISGINYSMPSLSYGTNLSYFEIFGRPNFSEDVAIQLSKCESIDNLDCGFVGGCVLGRLKLLENVNITNITIKSGFTNQTFDMNGLIIPPTVISFNFIGDNSKIINMPSNIKSSSGSELTSFTFNNSNLSDFSFLNDLTKLTSIDISNNDMTSITLNGTKLTLLKSLIMKENHLTGLKGIDTFNTITALDLRSNLLEDRSAYFDENGESITYNNLSEILKIHTNYNGSLTKLYISYNTGILDFSVLKNGISWMTIDV